MGQELGVQGLQEEEGTRRGHNRGPGCRGSHTVVNIKILMKRVPKVESNVRLGTIGGFPAI